MMRIFFDGNKTLDDLVDEIMTHSQGPDNIVAIAKLEDKYEGYVLEVKITKDQDFEN